MEQNNNHLQKVVHLHGAQREQTGDILACLFDYWEDLRGPREAPRRSEIDPRRIKAALNHTFIVEKTRFGGSRFRLAGTEVCDLMGMELRGMLLTALFDQTGQEELKLILKDIYYSASVYEFRLTSFQAGYRKVGAKMVLLPLTDDNDKITRIFGGIKLDRELLRPPVHFEILQSVKNRVICNTPLPAAHDIETRFSEEPTAFTRPNIDDLSPLRLVVDNDEM